MNKATSTLIAAVAALALSGGAYAQSAGAGSGGGNGNGSSGSTASPATSQMMNNSTSGYGTPGTTGSDSGTGSGLPNARMQPGMNGAPADVAPAPKTNNTLATPSVVSPVGNK
ncbi:hypothetical protein LFL96_25180 [Paraburkholderia sp. D15]|uniref:hypothetical protein n=1 Tax=Paraburkholderia sp. D15 TaxID=2880218 RepID=UPI00247A4909|nr:hypothetical protein [Paraburkholderia sp. D15]WGS54312.1 hypothetical protein LFL96_25180 [Paraburkholderia sp. D15]